MSTKSNLTIMLGFDCDRPRGDFIFTEEGEKMSNQKYQSIQKITKELDRLSIPRTFFVCGQFLESMATKFGNKSMKTVFSVDNKLVEIGDHTYSHGVVKQIPSRPDKEPSTLKKIEEEYHINTKLFEEILDLKIQSRGFRTPLGHYNGLKSENRLLELLEKLNVKYISSDLRDENESLNPPLKYSNGEPRQPYRYPNGLLEIPTMGWQDTVFSGTTRTPLYEKPPSTYDEIILYYQSLFKEAKKITEHENTKYYLGLTLHPYDNSIYNKNGKFFEDINNLASESEATFSTYSKANDEILK